MEPNINIIPLNLIFQFMGQRPDRIIRLPDGGIEQDVEENIFPFGMGPGMDFMHLFQVAPDVPSATIDLDREIIPFSKIQEQQIINLQNLLLASEKVRDESIDCYSAEQIITCFSLLHDIDLNSDQDKSNATRFVNACLESKVSKLIRKLPNICHDKKFKHKKLKTFRNLFQLAYSLADVKQLFPLTSFDLTDRYCIHMHGFEVNWVLFSLHAKDDKIARLTSTEKIVDYLQKKLVNSFEELHEAPLEVRDILANFKRGLTPSIYGAEAVEWWTQSQCYLCQQYPLIDEIAQHFSLDDEVLIDADKFADYASLHFGENLRAQQSLIKLLKIGAEHLFQVELLIDESLNPIERITVQENAKGMVPFVKNLIRTWKPRSLRISIPVLFPSNAKRRLDHGHESSDRNVRRKPETSKQPDTVSQRPPEDTEEAEAYKKTKFLDQLLDSAITPSAPLVELKLIQNRNEKLHPKEVEQIIHSAAKYHFEEISLPLTCLNPLQNYKAIFEECSLDFTLELPQQSQLQNYTQEELNNLGNIIKALPKCTLVVPGVYSNENIVKISPLLSNPNIIIVDFRQSVYWPQALLQTLLSFIPAKPYECYFSIPHHKQELRLLPQHVNIFIYHTRDSDIDKEDEKYDLMWLDVLFELFYRSFLHGNPIDSFESKTELSLQDLVKITKRSFTQTWWPSKRLSLPQDNREKLALIFFMNKLFENLKSNDFLDPFELAFDAYEVMHFCERSNILMHTIPFAIKQIHSHPAILSWLTLLQKELDTKDIHELLFHAIRLMDLESIEKVLQALGESEFQLSSTQKSLWENKLQFSSILKCHFIFAGIERNSQQASLFFQRVISSTPRENVDEQEQIIKLFIEYYENMIMGSSDILPYLSALVKFPAAKRNSELAKFFLSELSDEGHSLLQNDLVDDVIELLKVDAQNADGKTIVFDCPIEDALRFLQYALHAWQNPLIIESHPTLICNWLLKALEVYASTEKKLLQGVFKRLLLNPENHQMMYDLIQSYDKKNLEIFYDLFLHDQELRIRILDFKMIALALLSQPFDMTDRVKCESWVELVLLLASKGEHPVVFPRDPQLAITFSIQLSRLSTPQRTVRLKGLLPIAERICESAFLVKSWDDSLRNMINEFLRLQWLPDNVNSPEMIKLLLRHFHVPPSFTTKHIIVSVALFKAVVERKMRLNEAEQQAMVGCLKQVMKADPTRWPLGLARIDQVFLEMNHVIAEGLTDLVHKIDPKHRRQQNLRIILFSYHLKRLDAQPLSQERLLHLLNGKTTEDLVPIQIDHSNMDKISDLLRYNLSVNCRYPFAGLYLILVRISLPFFMSEEERELIMQTLVSCIEQGLIIPSHLDRMQPESAATQSNIRKDFGTWILQNNFPAFLNSSEHWLRFALEELFTWKGKLDIAISIDEIRWKTKCVYAVDLLVRYMTSREIHSSFIEFLFSKIRYDKAGTIFFSFIFERDLDPRFFKSKEFSLEYLMMAKKLDSIPEERVEKCLQMLSFLALPETPKSFYNLLSGTPQFLQIILKHVSDNWISFHVVRKKTKKLLLRVLQHHEILNEDTLEHVRNILQRFFPIVPKDIVILLAKQMKVAKIQSVLGRLLSTEEDRWIEEVKIPVRTQHIHDAKKLVDVPPIPDSGLICLPDLPPVNLQDYFRRFELNNTILAEEGFGSKEEFYSALARVKDDRYFASLSGFIAQLNGPDAFRYTARVLNTFQEQVLGKIQSLRKELEIAWLIYLYQGDKKKLQTFVGNILLRKKITSVPEDEAKRVKYFQNSINSLRWITTYLFFRNSDEIQDYLKVFAEVSIKCATAYQDVIRKYYELARQENGAVLPIIPSAELPNNSWIDMAQAINPNDKHYIPQQTVIQFGFLDLDTFKSQWKDLIANLNKNQIPFPKPISPEEADQFLTTTRHIVLWIHYLLEKMADNIDVETSLHIAAEVLAAVHSSENILEFSKKIRSAYAKASYIWLSDFKDRLHGKDQKQKLHLLLKKFILESKQADANEAFVNIIQYLFHSQPKELPAILKSLISISPDDFEKEIRKMYLGLPIGRPNYQELSLKEKILLHLHSKRWAFVREHWSLKYYQIPEGAEAHFRLNSQLQLQDHVGIYDPLSNLDEDEPFVPVNTDIIVEHIKSEFPAVYNQVFIIDVVDEAIRSHELTYEMVSDWFMRSPPEGFDSATVMQEVYDPVNDTIKREYLKYLLVKCDVFE